jgi:hypothetical protein
MAMLRFSFSRGPFRSFFRFDSSLSHFADVLLRKMNSITEITKNPRKEKGESKALMAAEMQESERLNEQHFAIIHWTPAGRCPEEARCGQTRRADLFEG